jgi:hypothetical protein
MNDLIVAEVEVDVSGIKCDEDHFHTVGLPDAAVRRECPLVNTKVPTWKARRNYRHLVRRYPQIAAALGYTEALSFPSPLSPVQQPVVPVPPRKEFPSGSPTADVTNPAPARRFAEQITGSQLEPSASAVPRMFSLEDEVL